MRTMSELLTITIVLLIATQNAQALRVYESQLSSNAVMVQISDEEAKAIVDDPDVAARLASEVTIQMLEIVGIPSSITGKVAMAPVAVVLSSKYSADIYRLSKKYGQGFTMKYHVDLEGVRQMWDISEVGDEIIPGTPAARAVLDVINRLVNTALE